MSHSTSGITILEPFTMDESASDLCWYPLHDPSSTNAELLHFAKQLYSESTAVHTLNQRNSGQSTTQAIGFPYSSPVAVVESSVLNRETATGVSNSRDFQRIPSDQTRTFQRKFSDYGTTAGGK